MMMKTINNMYDDADADHDIKTYRQPWRFQCPFSNARNRKLGFYIKKIKQKTRTEELERERERSEVGIKQRGKLSIKAEQ